MREALAVTGDFVGEEFYDNNLSAWKRNVCREDFERLFRKIETGQTTHVMVWHTDRYYRQMWDLERLIRAADAGLVVRHLYGEYDLSDADQRANARIICTMSQKASDDTSRRVRAKLVDNAKRGKLHGKRSYGYNTDGTQVPAEAAVIQEAARRRIDGEGWDAIAKDLTARNIRTVEHRVRMADGATRVTGGVHFTRTSLHKLMGNPRLAGLVLHDGELLGRVAEPILDEETWQELSLILSTSRHGARPDARYLLTGHVWCTECKGRKRGAIIREAKAAMPDGRPRRVYRCRSTESVRCARTVTAEYLEEVVGEYVKQALANPVYVAQVMAALHVQDDKSAAVQAELDRLTDAMAALVDNYSAGYITKIKYAESRERLRQRINARRAQLAHLQDPATVAAAQTLQVHRAWEEADTKGRRQLVDAVVERVWVSGVTGKRSALAPFDPSRVRVELVKPEQRLGGVTVLQPPGSLAVNLREGTRNAGT
jgi:DNA invertase Pin-like site-specific DNA recombinase